NGPRCKKLPPAAIDAPSGIRATSSFKLTTLEGCVIDMRSLQIARTIISSRSDKRDAIIEKPAVQHHGCKSLRRTIKEEEHHQDMDGSTDVRVGLRRVRAGMRGLSGKTHSPDR